MREELSSPKISPHVRAAVHTDGAAILDIASGTVTTLNTVGAEIWRHLEQGHTTDQIVEALSMHDGVPRGSADIDVHLFLRHLLDQQLIFE